MSDKTPEVKFDKYTEELLGKIKSEDITIDPQVWELLHHLIDNRVYALELTVGDFMSTPKWQLDAASGVLALLHKASGGSGKAPSITYYMERIQTNVDQIDVFMKRLREATEKKSGF